MTPAFEHCPDLTGSRCAQARAFLDSLTAGHPHILEPSLRELIDQCALCTARYNAIKWARSEASTDLVELEQFLGSAFQYGVDASNELDREWHRRAPNDRHQVEAFYRETPWYVYNLVLWEASGRRPDYVSQATTMLEQLECRTIIDFGAGVGNDSLKLAMQGYNVFAVEFDNAASQFLRYRAKARNLKNLTFINIDSADIDSLRADALWAMDVIEHLPDPIETLTPILANTRVFIFDSEHTGTSGGRQEFHFQHSKEELAEVWETQGYWPLEVVPDTATINVYARANFHKQQGNSISLKTAESRQSRAANRSPVTTVVLDLDGVVWRDNRTVSGVKSAIASIQERRLPLFYLTNNTTQSRPGLCKRMQDAGINARPDQIFTASYITATYLSTHRSTSSLYVTIGGADALIAELRARNLNCETLAEYVEKTHSDRGLCSIVIGHQPDFSYEEITRLLSVSSMVQEVFAAERDLWYSTSTGPMPSSAWMVAAVEEVLQKKAETLGKPNAIALNTLAEVRGVDVRSVLMVGDSLEVDVLAAHNSGSLSCYFDDPRVGVTRAPGTNASNADFVIRDLRELQYILKRLLRQNKGLSQ